MNANGRCGTLDLFKSDYSARSRVRSLQGPQGWRLHLIWRMKGAAFHRRICSGFALAVPDRSGLNESIGDACALICATSFVADMSIQEAVAPARSTSKTAFTACRCATAKRQLPLDLSGSCANEVRRGRCLQTCGEGHPELDGGPKDWLECFARRPRRPATRPFLWALPRRFPYRNWRRTTICPKDRHSGGRDPHLAS